jgi:hypothetical protein
MSRRNSVSRWNVAHCLLADGTNRSSIASFEFAKARVLDWEAHHPSQYGKESAERHEIHLTLYQTMYVARYGNVCFRSDPAESLVCRFRANCSATAICGNNATPIPSERHSSIASILENSMKCLGPGTGPKQVRSCCRSTSSESLVPLPKRLRGLVADSASDNTIKNVQVGRISRDAVVVADKAEGQGKPSRQHQWLARLARCELNTDRSEPHPDTLCSACPT